MSKEHTQEEKLRAAAEKRFSKSADKNIESVCKKYREAFVEGGMHVIANSLTVHLLDEIESILQKLKPQFETDSPQRIIINKVLNEISTLFRIDTRDYWQAQQQPKVLSEWQLCPKCSGQGTVSKPPYVAGDIEEWSSSSLSHVCDICNGTKMLIKPHLQPVNDAVEFGKWLLDHSGFTDSDDGPRQWFYYGPDTPMDTDKLYVIFKPNP